MRREPSRGASSVGAAERTAGTAGACDLPTHDSRLPDFLRTYSSLVALAVLVVYNVLFTANFLSLGTFNANLTQVATIVIVAVGMTFVIATGGIDLSVGSLMAIAGVLAPLFLLDAQQFGAPVIGLALAIVAPLMATTLCGAFNGTLVTVVGLQPIIATLVLYLAGRGIAQVIVNGELREFRNLGSPMIPNFEFIGLGQVFGVRFQVLIMLVVVVVAAWVLQATTFGRYVLATGGNASAARLAGVPVNQVKMAVYCISGFLAGLAGLIVVAINRSSDPHRVGRVHGARRHRGGGRGRHAALRRAGDDPGDLHRRPDHPAPALHARSRTTSRMASPVW